jgi:hypothetical protein
MIHSYRTFVLLGVSTQPGQVQGATFSRKAPRIDSTILKATARAHRWFDDLVLGRSASMVEIGKRKGVGKRYVGRMIRLAFLAPAGCRPI